MNYEDTIKFEEGAMWERGPWEISFNTKCSRLDGGKPCKHCYSTEALCGEREAWICPRVVIGNNEGGLNSTGICLDCILEAVKGIDIDDK